MKNSVKFFRAIWKNSTGEYSETIESAHSRRYLMDLLRCSDNASQLIKVQEIETPMIDVEWFARLFAKGASAKERAEHAEQCEYVLRLIEASAARVLLGDGETIER